MMIIRLVCVRGFVVRLEGPGAGVHGRFSVVELGGRLDEERAVGVDGDGDIAFGLLEGAWDGE